MNSDNVCEEKVFKTLFNLHNKELQTFFYYKYGNLDKAKDHLQDAFLQLWKNCKKVSFSKAKGYLFIIVKNAFLNEFKRETMKNKHHEALSSGLFNIEAPDYLMEEKEFLEKINLSVSKLPDDQREIFLLNRIDKKKYREIAEMLGISIKTVEKKMHLALVFLRERIGNV